MATTKKTAAKKAAKKKVAGTKAKAATRRKAAPVEPELPHDEDAARSAAGKSLVIVESPAKAKTIGKYLGSAYAVKATVGHIRDLPVKNIGIDTEHGFEPRPELAPDDDVRDHASAISQK